MTVVLPAPLPFLHLAQEPGAHADQRLGHPGHRPATQGIVAGHERGERMAGERAQQEARAGAGVAEIERPVGLAQATDADPMDVPHTGRIARDLDA